MARKLLVTLAFAAVLGAGTVTAGALAGKPSSTQQTVSTSTTGSTTTTTGSTTTGTTGTTTTGTTTTTTTPTTTTTVPTTTTTPERKVTICHHTQGKKGTKHVTITVSRSALKAHMKHGDSLGRCNTAAAKRFHSRPAHVKKFHHKAKAGGKGKAHGKHGR
jgi:hypothetical protein